eukprot:TRINITY_DN450_c0_g1_i3.p1 TRINITY_DN450_c0_g1~~TRINITY_DN450_c0_g1_i3.p1  ORF type:complete len:201 (-),score=15.21 TRINITY_DN450_c0_g1_i3:83-685(-)
MHGFFKVWSEIVWISYQSHKTQKCTSFQLLFKCRLFELTHYFQKFPSHWNLDNLYIHNVLSHYSSFFSGHDLLLVSTENGISFESTSIKSTENMIHKFGYSHKWSDVTIRTDSVDFHHWFEEISSMKKGGRRQLDFLQCSSRFSIKSYKAFFDRETIENKKMDTLMKVGKKFFITKIKLKFFDDEYFFISFCKLLNKKII